MFSSLSETALALRTFQIVAPLVCVMLSTVVHEASHAWVAWKLGDPTAKMAGRLSLNPAKHLDPFGSVLLPLVMAYMGGPVFAYAKPVPFNPYNLRKPERDEALVALAGPVSNLLQAAVAAAAYALLHPGYTGGYTALFWVLSVLSVFVIVNCSLAFFNLIPLPPLDGSKILSLFVKGEARDTYSKIQYYSMPILLIALYVLPSLLGFDPLGIYIRETAGRLADFLLSLGV